jgi:Fic family protein
MIQSATIRITLEILGLVVGIDEFKGAWRALGTLAPDRLSALLRLATIESVGSATRIEGSKLPDRDIERLLSKLQIQKLGTSDEQEVAGHAKVLETVFTSWRHIALTENHIKQLHRDLLVHIEKHAWHRGHDKTSTNNVVAFDEIGTQLGVVFETARPFDTPRLMTELVTWFVEERDARRVHPLLLIGLWIVVYRKIERETLVLAVLPEMSLRIVEFAREHGRITMTDTIRLTGSSRNTLKQHFRALVERGQLSPHSAGRGAWYALR